MSSILPESRKLSGLIIVLAALLVLAVIAIVAVSVFGVGEGLFTNIGGYISAMGVGHQASQAAADRSPNYPGVAPSPPEPPAARSPPAPGGNPGMP